MEEEKGKCFCMIFGMNLLLEKNELMCVLEVAHF